MRMMIIIIRAQQINIRDIKGEIMKLNCNKPNCKYYKGFDTVLPIICLCCFRLDDRAWKDRYESMGNPGNHNTIDERN